MNNRLKPHGNDRAWFLLTGFIYCTLTWLTIVWVSDYLDYTLLRLALAIVFPIVFGVVIYLIFLDKFDEDWFFPFFVLVILFPIFYSLSFATRAAEYVTFVHSGYSHFVGGVSQIESDRHLFYELRGFTIEDPKTGEFGVSYSVSRRKSSGTSHAKHFVVPVFDKDDSRAPRLWLFDSYHSGSVRADKGDHGIYGFDRTGLSKRLSASVIYGKRLKHDDARRAVAQYLKKQNSPPVENPLVLELVDEPAESYYRKGKIHLLILTVLLNIIFTGVCFYVTGKTPKV